MASLELLAQAWQIVAENRIRTAQEEGEFNNLRGFGRPLEEFLDIKDPGGWARRSAEESRNSERKASRSP